MTKDKRTGWLAELNPGDKIILVNNPRWFKTSRTVRAVSKITPTVESILITFNLCQMAFV
ncbi:TPA: hypothetical protein ACQNXU_000745 [Streptococcus pyogenes]